tara:strand:- start:30700 stop:31545 length:846 start_codon:yes stop_codon:yes gene_type:complete
MKPAKKPAAKKTAKPKPKPPTAPPQLIAQHWDPATNTIIATYRTSGGTFKLPITPQELGEFLASIPWSVLPDDDGETLDCFKEAAAALDAINPPEPKTSNTMTRTITSTIIAAAAAVLSLAASSCTSYTQYDAQTGHKTHSFTSTGNFGYTTDQIAERQSNTGGINVLGGSNAADILTEARENEQGLATLTIGDMEITGTIDHSTWLEVAGDKTRQIIRDIVTGKVLGAAIDGLLQSDLAETAAGTDALNIESSTTRALSQDATKIAKDQIASDTAQALAP